MNEKYLQSFAGKLLSAYRLPYCHIPNVITRRINGRFVSIVPNTGNQGWPDIIALGPDGRILLMELKRETGRLSAVQEAFRDWCRNNGHAYTVCRTTEEIEQAVKALAGG